MVGNKILIKKFHNKLRFIFVFKVVILFILTNILLNNLISAEKPRIVLSMQISHTKIPLNRTLQLTIILKWENDPNRYEIIKFEEPVLTNFKIIGSAVSSRSEVSKGTTNIIKEYIFTLKPQSLGMGYIDGIVARVRDNITGITERLETQRISVEIIDPIPESAKLTRTQLYVTLGIIIVLITAGIIILLYRSKKYREKQEILSYTPPIEKNYLDELKNTFNLQQPNLREDFFTLSRLIRKYLKEKFAIPALELTTEELTSSLEKLKLDENQINNIKKILIRSDEIKFSGKEGTYEEINQFYTLFESLLEKYYSKTEQQLKQSSEKEK